MKYLILVASLIFCMAATAEDESESDTPAKTTKEDPLRCERFIKSSLKELKNKLQDNCDLNKPFSTSLAMNIGEEHYMYCCHKKK